MEGERTHCGKMGQIEELKLFVSERLHAVASEIVGAIEKTITDYEEQASRLREDNDRNRSLLDIILKTKRQQPEAADAIDSNLAAKSTHASKSSSAGKSTPAVKCTYADSPHASDSSSMQEGREPLSHSSDLQFVFTSRTDFLKFATNTVDGNCPYCIKTIEASDAHLMRRHYLMAVHFIEDGTENFVVPCLCKDKIQVNGRSHWHCPLCKKIIFRKTNFEQHLSKQHCIAILQERQDADIYQPPISAFEEAPLSSDSWGHQELSSFDHNGQQTSILLHVKEDNEQDMWKPVSHPELLISEQLRIKGNQIEKGTSHMGEQSLDAGFDHYSESNLCAGSYIQYPSEINSMDSDKGHPLSDSSTQPDGSNCVISLLAGEYQQASEDKIDWKTQAPLSSKALSSNRKNLFKRSLPSLGFKTKKSVQSSASKNPTGPHCCKACGKSFHYMYTLRTHVQAHAVDNKHICGICGKHLKPTEDLIEHLQSHKKGNKCTVCGKQFSNNSRLKRHMTFHRPKGINFSEISLTSQMGKDLQMS